METGESGIDWSRNKRQEHKKEKKKDYKLKKQNETNRKGSNTYP